MLLRGIHKMEVVGSVKYNTSLMAYLPVGEASSKGSGVKSRYNDSDNANLAGFLYFYYYFLP